MIGSAIDAFTSSTRSINDNNLILKAKYLRINGRKKRSSKRLVKLIFQSNVGIWLLYNNRLKLVLATLTTMRRLLLYGLQFNLVLD